MRRHTGGRKIADEVRHTTTCSIFLNHLDGIFRRADDGLLAEEIETLFLNHLVNTGQGLQCFVSTGHIGCFDKPADILLGHIVQRFRRNLPRLFATPCNVDGTCLRDLKILRSTIELHERRVISRVERTRTNRLKMES